MASISDFKFSNMSRIGNDDCSMSQRNIQNTESANYMLANFFLADCNMSKAVSLATSQPDINFTGSHQVGVGGCNVDINSNLLIDKNINHPKCRISLYQRPFATVPYLGRGPVEPETEFKIQTGQAVSSRRTETHLTEQSLLPYHNTPLIPEVASTIDNPANLVEGVADKNWVRGGQPSRELAKCDSHYNQ